MANPFGVVVNPRGGMPAASDLHALGGDWARSIIYTVGDIGALRIPIPSTIKLCVMLNNECADVGWDWSGWEAALHAIVAQYRDRVQAVECGNELDRFWAMNENDVPPAFGADLVNRAKAILAPAGIKTLLAPVAGPKWQEWMQQAIALCDPDGVAFHPYGQRPDGFKAPGWGFGDLRPAIARAYAIGQRPVWLTEFGVKLSDAGGLDGQAEYAKTAVQTIAALGQAIVPMACYFALSDQVGTGSEQGNDAFGLIGASGNYRPAFGAYRAAIQTAVLPQPLPTPDPEPEPAPLPSPDPFEQMTADDASLMDIWTSFRADIPFAPESAIGRLWKTAPSKFGPPVGIERYDRGGDGSPTVAIQSFASGARLRWQAGQAEAEVA